ncbi:MAG: metalloregulator ArsR/SmtB family transcription factor [Anaerolineaceae bacterium]|nr:metalloregulator ArsR/SmtB family transcription factor [Anaerolineaceae bacterium]
MNKRTLPIDNDTAEQIAWAFQGLGDSTRIKLIAILLEGEMNVSDLAELAGISQSGVSHQLRVLRNLHFVSTRREGQQIFYRIDDEHITDLYLLAYAHSGHQAQEDENV